LRHNFELFRLPHGSVQYLTQAQTAAVVCFSLLCNYFVPNTRAK